MNLLRLTGRRRVRGDILSRKLRRLIHKPSVPCILIERALTIPFLNSSLITQLDLNATKRATSAPT